MDNPVSSTIMIQHKLISWFTQFPLFWHTLLIRQYTNLWPCYQTGHYHWVWPVIKKKEVSIDYLQRVQHENRSRGRLTPTAHDPVQFETCKCYNFETILSKTCHVSWLLFRTFFGVSNFFSEIRTEFSKRGDSFDSKLLACQHRTLTPPDTCPTLELANVLMLRPISPELVLFQDLWVSNIPRYFCFYF